MQIIPDQKGWPEPALDQIGPECVLDWLVAIGQRDAWSDDDKSLRSRVLIDSRMSNVVRQLVEISDDLQPIAEFLGEAIRLPGLWEHLSKNSKKVEEQELLELQRGAERFLSLMKKHEGSVRAFLIPIKRSEISERSAGNPLAQAQENYSKLEQLVRMLQMSTAYFLELSSSVETPRMSRKQTIKNAKLIFFVKQLTDSAQHRFGEPLHAAVGLLATLCLRREVLLGPDEVTQMCRPPRKKKARRPPT